MAIYSVLKAGGAYVPLDPTYPADRIAGILEDIGSPVLLTTDKYKHHVPKSSVRFSDDTIVDVGGGGGGGGGGDGGGGGKGRHRKLPLVILVEERVAAIADAIQRKVPVPSPPPEWKPPHGGSPVYVFFTSGTTGKPKGVVVEHRGLVHRTLWLQDEYKMQPHERTALKHGYTFGLSEWEIFWPICVGGGLVLMEPGGEKHADYVFSLTQRENITHMFFVPSMLRMLLEYIEVENVDTNDFPLRMVVTCGEALVLETVQKLFSVLPRTAIHNLYGPTEGEMTLWRCPKGVHIPYVPIGRPMSGSKVYVCDKFMQPCAVNEPGELHFGGPFIAREYLGLPGQTASKFIPDPFVGQGVALSPRKASLAVSSPPKKGGAQLAVAAAEDDDDAGETSEGLQANTGTATQAGEPSRLYKTGDLAVWRSDGNLEFLGRIDNQVKLRGFRIELGEIESVMRGYGVQHAVVVLVGDGASQYLAAYCAPASDDDVPLIRSECLKKLPAYMVPAVILPLPAMPLTGARWTKRGYRRRHSRAVRAAMRAAARARSFIRGTRLSARCGTAGLRC